MTLNIFGEIGTCCCSRLESCWGKTRDEFARVRIWARKQLFARKGPHTHGHPSIAEAANAGLAAFFCIIHPCFVRSNKTTTHIAHARWHFQQGFMPLFIDAAAVYISLPASSYMCCWNCLNNCLSGKCAGRARHFVAGIASGLSGLLSSCPDVKTRQRRVRWVPSSRIEQGSQSIILVGP